MNLYIAQLPADEAEENGNIMQWTIGSTSVGVMHPDCNTVEDYVVERGSEDLESVIPTIELASIDCDGARFVAHFTKAEARALAAVLSQAAEVEL